MSGAAAPRPLAAFPRERLAGVRVVLTDVDGTLTTGGRMTATALAALERLHETGLLVIAVTGGPAGWCDHMARAWPIDAAVGESGAFWFRRLPGGGLERRFAVAETELPRLRERRDRLGEQVLAEVPGSALAVDQRYRELDLAVDWCENVPALPADSVAHIERLMQRAGARTAVSSIHVNAWFGAYDKLATSRRLLAECFGLDTADPAARARCIYVGDAPNDAPAFAYFPDSVGVANVSEFGARLPAQPRWITPSAGGAGFVELADTLLAARSRT